MHIVIVCAAGYVSGKEIMALELANGLHACGDSVEFVVSYWNNGEFIRRLTDAGTPYTVLPIGFFSATLTPDCLRMTGEQMLRWPGLLLGYRRFLRDKKPRHVIHTNWQHLLLIWPFLKPERDLFWLHEVVPDKPQYRRLFGLLERRLGCFVCVSNAVARSLAAIGIASDKIRVIYNGIKDPVPFGTPGVPPSAGQRTGMTLGPPEGGTPNEQKHDALRVGIVGQVGMWKGHLDLLSAFASVAQGNERVELHIFGRGQEQFEQQLKHEAAKMGIADRVVWHGFVADRGEIYRTMDICVVPSRSEDPLPTTAIEASYFALPVIATRQGGLPEIVEDGETGILVEAGHIEGLAAALRKLLDDEPLRASMGMKARLRAATQFNRERLVEEFVSLLRSHANRP